MENQKKSNGKIPTIHVIENSIPAAYYSVLKAVHEEGYPLRTQYDRKDSSGNYIDPPGKDTKFMIEIRKPFAQPRFPVLSYAERGKYIAEFLGAKDHLVVPHKKLLKMIHQGEEFEPTQWPYCYHQRLTAYPKSDGTTINQLKLIADKLIRDPITRRAIAITGVPEIDLFIKQDMPCLREIQLRLIRNKEGQFVLNSHARWRSRDCYKAWGDNIIGITNLIQIEVIPYLEKGLGEKIIFGPYTEENGSLHNYGQDYTEKGLDTLFDKFPTKESFIERARTSEREKKAMIIPELEDLKKETTWNFPPESIKLIDKLIEDYQSDRFIP
tara:strand:+ start:3149 stop:4126 length:978 start_codon:yes stop_codon:yes gene_type:complete